MNDNKSQRNLLEDIVATALKKCPPVSANQLAFLSELMEINIVDMYTKEYEEAFYSLVARDVELRKWVFSLIVTLNLLLSLDDNIPETIMSYIVSSASLELPESMSDEDWVDSSSINAAAVKRVADDSCLPSLISIKVLIPTDTSIEVASRVKLGRST